MAEDAPKKNPFVTMFIPGLVLGLVVGGVAGALLPVFFENKPPPLALPANGPAKPKPTTADRDARPPNPDAPKPADAKPPEPKPEETPAPPK